MVKSRKNNSNALKNFKKTASKTLPVVNKGLENAGETAKNIAVKSVPLIEKGVSAVYGTMASGLDLGVKGVKSVAKGMSRRKQRGGRRRSSRKTRTRKTRR
jgi:hypothetical protein